MSKGESSHPQDKVNMEEKIFTRIVERLAVGIASVQSDPEKKYEIERLNGCNNFRRNHRYCRCRGLAKFA